LKNPRTKLFLSPFEHTVYPSGVQLVIQTLKYYPEISK